MKPSDLSNMLFKAAMSATPTAYSKFIPAKGTLITRPMTNRERKAIARKQIYDTFLSEWNGETIRFSSGRCDWVLHSPFGEHELVNESSGAKFSIDRLERANPCTVLRIIKLIKKQRLDEHSKNRQAIRESILGK